MDYGNTENSQFQIFFDKVRCNFRLRETRASIFRQKFCKFVKLKLTEDQFHRVFQIDVLKNGLWGEGGIRLILNKILIITDFEQNLEHS